MMKENSIDFREQRALFQNLNRLKKVSKSSEESTGSVIGFMMMVDHDTQVSYGLKARFHPDSTEENPMLEITAKVENTHEKYTVSILQVDTGNATLLEIFALCSYADYNKVVEASAFGTFRELKNFVCSANNIKIRKKGATYQAFVAETGNWETIVHMIKEQFLAAGIYTQYQMCLKILDIFDFIKEKRKDRRADSLTKEYYDSVKTMKTVQDQTAEAVLKMMQAESEKYCID